MNKKYFANAALAAVALVAFTGCTPDPVSTSGGGTPSAGPESAIQKQELDQALHDRLPEKIKDAGTIVAVNSGSFPPYVEVADGNEITGATADLAVALGEILGVEIQHETVDGLASVLSGMQAQRYDLNLGPTGDFKERQAQGTFVDWVQEYVVFAVQKGNPQEITGLDSTCGKKIAVMSSGSAEAVIMAQAEKCAAEGKPELEVQSYKDQPSSILAVQSKRADAFFSSQAPLTYFVDQANGDLELAGVGQSNGFDDLYQGAVVPVDSPLAEILKEALQTLQDNGTYEAIMTKWGLADNMIDDIDINKAVS